jgi:hypothetical protein
MLPAAAPCPPLNAADVIKDVCVGPVPLQHSAAPLVDFGLPQDAHSCALKAEVEASDP